MSVSPERQAHFDAIVERLRGTCQSLHDVLQDGDEGLEDDPDFCSTLDEELMLCNTCGWWEESALVDDEGNCEQCSDGEDDDD